jgi:hypothetical protein
MTTNFGFKNVEGWGHQDAAAWNGMMKDLI